MIHVFLDDYRPCPPGFVAAKSAEECILLLEAEEVDILSLDYDLGWGNPTGLDVVRYIADNGRYPRHLSHCPMPDSVAAEAAGKRV
jgi:hypothetical protein